MKKSMNVFLSLLGIIGIISLGAMAFVEKTVNQDDFITHTQYHVGELQLIKTQTDPTSLWIWFWNEKFGASLTWYTVLGYNNVDDTISLRYEWIGYQQVSDKIESVLWVGTYDVTRPNEVIDQPTLYWKVIDDGNENSRWLYVEPATNGFHHIMTRNWLTLAEYAAVTKGNELLPFSRCPEDLYICEGGTMKLRHPDQWERVSISK